MSSIVIAGDTSGSVTLQAPAVAGSTVITLPSTSTTLVSSQWTTTGSDIYYNTGNVSVGTSSPVAYGGFKTLTLNGSTGGLIQLQSNGTSTGRFYAPSATNTVIDTLAGDLTVYATGSLFLGTGSATKVTVDTSGNLGLGLTPSGSWGTQAFMLAKSGASNPTYPFIASTDSQAVFIGSNSYWDGTNWKAQFGGAGVVAMHQKFNYNAISWHTAPAVTTGNTQTFTQAMTLTSGGDLRVGQTAGVGANGGRMEVYVSDNFNGAPNLALNTGANNTGGIYLYFTNAAGTKIGSVTQASSTSVAYNTTSDYRLKDNVKPMTGALARIQALNPVTYTWKEDGSDSEGFIAHELQAVIPKAVTGKKDEVDGSGKPNYQSIDNSFLVATLTAAIQEQQALINTLTERISVLENK